MRYPRQSWQCSIGLRLTSTTSAAAPRSRRRYGSAGTTRLGRTSRIARRAGCSTTRRTIPRPMSRRHARRCRGMDFRDRSGSGSTATPTRRVRRSAFAAAEVLAPLGTVSRPDGSTVTLLERQQDEYCEWHTHRDTQKRITRITFTCEGPEYFEEMAAVDLTLVGDLYREHVDPAVADADLVWDADMRSQGRVSSGAAATTSGTRGTRARARCTSRITPTRSERRSISRPMRPFCFPCRRRRRVPCRRA